MTSAFVTDTSVRKRCRKIAKISTTRERDAFPKTLSRCTRLMFSSTEASTSQWENNVFVSPSKAPAWMILDVYGAEDCSRLSLLGCFRSTMLDPRDIVIIGAVCLCYLHFRSSESTQGASFLGRFLARGHTRLSKRPGPPVQGSGAGLANGAAWGVRWWVIRVHLIRVARYDTRFDTREKHQLSATSVRIVIFGFALPAEQCRGSSHMDTVLSALLPSYRTLLPGGIAARARSRTARIGLACISTDTSLFNT